MSESSLKSLEEKYNNYNSFYSAIASFYPEFIKVFPEYEEKIDSGMEMIFLYKTEIQRIDDKLIELDSDDSDNNSELESLNQERTKFLLTLMTKKEVNDFVSFVKSRLINMGKFLMEDDKSIFDIDYPSRDDHDKEPIIQTEIFPNIDWRILWNTEDITDTTRTTLWNYLNVFYWSLLMFMNGSEYEGFMSMFNEEGEGREEQMNKMFENMFKFAENMNNSTSDGSGNVDMSNTSLPDPEKIKGHFDKLLSSRIGKLAQEIAEELASELNINPESIDRPEDIMKIFMSNPAKLMKMVKNIESKIKTKMAEYGMKEEELMGEIMELFKSEEFGNMPGFGDMMKQMSSMFGNGFGNPLDMLKNLGKIGKNPAALGMMNSKLNNESRANAIRQRLQKKLAEKDNVVFKPEGSEPVIKSSIKDKPKNTKVKKNNKKKKGKGKKKK